MPAAAEGAVDIDAVQAGLGLAKFMAARHERLHRLVQQDGGVDEGGGVGAHGRGAQKLKSLSESGKSDCITSASWAS